MQLFSAAALSFVLFVAMTSETTPRDAVMLELERDGGFVQLQLVGDSPMTQRVRYEITFTGQSTSHLRGSAQLEAGRRHVLTTMRMSTGPRWCVKIAVEEGDGRRYELNGGEC